MSLQQLCPPCTVDFIHLAFKEDSIKGCIFKTSKQTLGSGLVPLVPWLSSVQMANYLELCQLLHELFLLFAIGEWRQMFRKDFEQVQALSRHADSVEDRGDAVEEGRE